MIPRNIRTLVRMFLAVLLVACGGRTAPLTDRHAGALEISAPDAAAGPACVEPPPGMLGWWALDETAGTGTTVADLAGASPGLALHGPTVAPGQVDGALRFDGAAYVGAPDSDRWAFGNRDFTVELWANWDTVIEGTVGHPGTIFIGNDEGPGSVNKWFFALGGGFLNVALNSPTLGPQFFPLVPFAPVAARWYHLAVTRQGNLYTIYVDGQALGSDSRSFTIPNADAPLTIGQAEELGFMRGRLDEVTVYDRALTATELQDIYQAGSAGKCKGLRIATTALSAVQLGKPVAQQLRAVFGQGARAWSLVAGTLPAGVNLASDGLMAGIPTQAGRFPVTVEVTDAAGTTARRDFILAVLLAPPPPTVRISKTATVAVPGRVIDHFILVENTGDTTATNLQVTQELDPATFSFVSATPEAIVEPGNNVLVFDIPELAPGEIKTVGYQAKLNPNTPPGGILARSPACLVSDQTGLSGCILRSIASVGLCAVCIAPCAAVEEACATFFACAKVVRDCLNCANACGVLLVHSARCFEDRAACADHPQPVRAALDPNEKLVLAEKFIRSDQLLVYPIHFENIGTAEARDVFVTDTLAPELDPATAKVLTPGGSIDAVTGAVRWDLQNVNLQPAATGSVLLSLRPRPGLPSGTEIRNKATIRFEVFQPMETAEVVNVIDDVAPSCVIDPLPAVTPTSDFRLSWTARDPVGEVAAATVWVATDGGSFTPLAEDVTTASLTFHGEAGHRYAFLCAARDTAGNVEAGAALAEAETRVVANHPPRCDQAKPTTAVLWPPNHRLHLVGVIVGDPDGDRVHVQVTSVTQDEPTREGDCGVSPDARLDDGRALLRAERLDRGNGRVYHLHFKADDGRGGACTGTARVSVPHDQGAQAARDDGERYDSLRP